MDKSEDGKTRMRCTGCGKRVKFSATRAGATFHCPKCKAMIIAPLDWNDTEEKVLDPAHKQPATRPVKKPVLQRTEPKPESPAVRKVEEKAPALDRLNVFLVNEQRRVGFEAAKAAREQGLPKEEKIARLQALRHEKAVNTRALVQQLMTELDEALAILHADPAADTDTGKVRIAKVEHERNALVLYLRVIFQMRTVHDDDHRSAAKPDTP